MTIKQDRVIAILESDKTRSLRSAAIEAGYTEQTASTQIYTDIRNPENKIAKYLATKLSKENILKEAEEITRDAKTYGANGLNPRCRVVEFKAKLGGHLKDEVNVNTVNNVLAIDSKGVAQLADIANGLKQLGASFNCNDSNDLGEVIDV